MSLISEVSEVGMKESAKRRFIKGSLAAPVVLTVSSASATAMTSFGRCLRNGPGQTQPAFFIDPTRGADRFVRKLVKVDQLWQAGEIKGTFYMDPVLNRYVSTQAPHSALSFGSATLPGGWKVTQRFDRWALVYFDDTTAAQYRYITLQKPTGYTITTTSCYSSFVA